MATLATAREKYARKMQTAATNWNAAKGRMSQNYGAGMSRFLSAPVAGTVVQAYQSGIAAAQYRAGDADKWAANFVAKMTGR